MILRLSEARRNSVYRSYSEYLGPLRANCWDMKRKDWYEPRYFVNLRNSPHTYLSGLTYSRNPMVWFPTQHFLPRVQTHKIYHHSVYQPAHQLLSKSDTSRHKQENTKTFKYLTKRVGLSVKVRQFSFSIAYWFEWTKCTGKILS